MTPTDEILGLALDFARNNCNSNIYDKLRAAVEKLETDRAALEADAYRHRAPGLRVTSDADGVWLRVEAPSGKQCAINLEALAIQRGGLVGAALLEWVDAQVIKGEGS